MRGGDRAEYYFDIETYSPEPYPDPDNDKIITIQFQKIDLKTGKPKGDLNILKEWESSEEAIVKEFFNRFFKDRRHVWDFVPVGFNLNFEWEFLISKFERYVNKKFSSRDLHYSIPHLDLKRVVVLLNGGEFKGASLDRFSGKENNGRVIQKFYEMEEYDKICDYIKNETESFLELLQDILPVMKGYGTQLKAKHSAKG